MDVSEVKGRCQVSHQSILTKFWHWSTVFPMAYLPSHPFPLPLYSFLPYPRRPEIEFEGLTSGRVMKNFFCVIFSFMVLEFLIKSHSVLFCLLCFFFNLFVALGTLGKAAGR